MARTVNRSLQKRRTMNFSLDEYIEEKQIFIGKSVARIENKFKAERRIMNECEDGDEGGSACCDEGANNEEAPKDHTDDAPVEKSQAKMNFGINKAKCAQDLRLKISVRSNARGVQRGGPRQLQNTKNCNTLNWKPWQNRRNGFNNSNNSGCFNNNVGSPGRNIFGNSNGFPQSFGCNGKFGSYNNNRIGHNGSNIAVNETNYTTPKFNGNNYANNNGNFQQQRGPVPLMAIKAGYNSMPSNNYQHEGAVQIPRGNNVTLIVPKPPELARRAESNVMVMPGIRAITGQMAGTLFNDNAPLLAQLFLNACSSALIHKPIYDLDIQGEIHALQQKPLKSSNFGPISGNGPGIESFQVTPHLGCMSLHHRFT